MKMKLLALPVTAGLLMTGCANTGNSPVFVPTKTVTYAQAANTEFTPTNYAAADSLIRQLKHNAAPNSTLIIATLADIDDLSSSSTLGRLVSEQVAARFTQHNYRAVELKFRDNVFMSKGQGELMLTREVAELAKAQAAQAVVVGTYARSMDFIYINLKVIQPTTNTVIAVHDYTLPMDNNNRSMLRSND